MMYNEYINKRKVRKTIMNINANINVTLRQNGTLEVMINDRPLNFNEKNTEVDWKNLYNLCKGAPSNRKQSVLDDFIARGIIEIPDSNDENSEETKSMTTEERLVRGLECLINFFSEFDFEPNFRFINTLSYKVADTLSSAREYINNYFSLMDNSYTNEISAKIKSKEFDNILKDIKAGGKPQNTVNKRFKIYYGSAGTGKTTLAMGETDKRCIVCNASMLPSDLMEDFVFVNGQPSFQPSKLWRCMEEGLPIVLDEINLLPFDSLRFLQGILDGKSEFDYKGHKVTINDGFQIIGTMNLTIGGMTYGLPEPLVDRSSDMKKFSLSAEMLKSAILG